MEVNFSGIDSPALLIEHSKLKGNIKQMQALADSNGIKLRPHIKTHKMPEIAKLQIDSGGVGIAASKLSEAEVFLNRGFGDIQIANIIVGEYKLDRLLSFHSKAERLTVCVDSIECTQCLSNKFSEAGRILEVFIKIDSGFGRCGLSDFNSIKNLAKLICNSSGLKLSGILTHSGQIYTARNRAEVEEIGRNEGILMVETADKLRKEGIEINEISIGSTPGAEYSSTIEGVKELRAGNYVFYDMIQVGLGVIGIENCALSVLASVVSTPAKDRAIIDAGSKSLGLDRGAHSLVQTKGYGYIYGKNAEIVRLSEEHGIILHSGERFQVGEKIRIIPNHACAVSNLYDYAHLVDGENYIGKIAIEARGKSQ